MSTLHANKRIVSKADYVGIMGRRITVRALASFLVIAGVGGVGATAGLICIALTSETPWYFEILLLPLALAFGLLIVTGKEGLKSIRKEPLVVPLTRQTAQELPEQDSLVRASSVQDTANDSNLLRPAAETHDDKPDELLRSAAME